MDGREGDDHPQRSHRVGRGEAAAARSARPADQGGEAEPQDRPRERQEHGHEQRPEGEASQAARQGGVLAPHHSRREDAEAGQEVRVQEAGLGPGVRSRHEVSVGPHQLRPDAEPGQGHACDRRHCHE